MTSAPGHIELRAPPTLPRRHSVSLAGWCIGSSLEAVSRPLTSCAPRSHFSRLTGTRSQDVPGNVIACREMRFRTPSRRICPFVESDTPWCKTLDEGKTAWGCDKAPRNPGSLGISSTRLITHPSSPSKEFLSMADNDNDTSSPPFGVRLRAGTVQPEQEHERLIVEPGTTPMDDTDRLALGVPRFRTEERIVNIITGENEVVSHFKQVMTGAWCDDVGHGDGEGKGLVERPYCPKCYNALRPPGYVYHGHLRLLDIYIEWGGVLEPGVSPGHFVAHADFEYVVTPGDFFQLGNVIDNTAFNVGAGYSERHDNEGVPALWRVLNVITTHDETGFPMMWEFEGRVVEDYEPVAAFYRNYEGDVVG